MMPDEADPNDVFDDNVALAADLAMHESMLWSRAALSERLAEASLSRDPRLLDELRIESMYQFCEFFYLVRAQGITSGPAIAALADLHNRHMEALLKDREKMKRLKLTPKRVLDAVITGDMMPRLVEIWSETPGRIDQSNLGRFLVTVMSAETSRSLAVAATEAGFMTRSAAKKGLVLVRSTGIMERVFGGVLRDLRLRIARIDPTGED